MRQECRSAARQPASFEQSIVGFLFIEAMSLEFSSHAVAEVACATIALVRTNKIGLAADISMLVRYLLSQRLRSPLQFSRIPCRLRREDDRRQTRTQWSVKDGRAGNSQNCPGPGASPFRLAFRTRAAERLYGSSIHGNTEALPSN